MIVGSGQRSPEEHARASAELEERCDFSGSALEALHAGDPRRAANLAALGGDALLAARAVEAIAADLPREVALRAAADLAARGFGGPAGALFARLGAHGEAGEAFIAAGDAVSAARSLDLAGRPADGARALEAALRERPEDAACRLELGRLLARHGRIEAAATHLQRVGAEVPERLEALPWLRRCLLDLGLEDAARAIREEMDRRGVEDPPRGGPPVPASSAPPAHASATPPGAARGPLILGRYASLRAVTATAHAQVVEAIDRVTSERVAVKLLAGAHEGSGRDALLRFEREARALAQLRHPNVVPLRAYHPEGPAIVLAWMSGGSLGERIEADEDVAPARAAEIAAAVLAALGEAHRLGILHRDVKPSNVLFDDAGATRLGDFGAAHLGAAEETATAGAIGTFAYMSPEQRLGRAATLASDLYGVGVLLAEMLTGEAPGPARGRLELPPSACHPDLGEAHDAVLARLLQEDPEQRPADAFEARRLIEGVSWPTRIVPRGERRRKRRPEPRALDAPGERLGPAHAVGDGRDVDHRAHDAWLDRDVLVLPLDDETRARVSAFSRANHPALPVVLRADEDGGAFWVAPPLGRALADAPRELSPAERARIAEAIEALHAAQGAHGCVDEAHLYLCHGEISLAYPRSLVPLEEAAALDRITIARLRGLAVSTSGHIEDA